MSNFIFTKRLKIRKLKESDIKSINKIILNSKLWIFFGFDNKPSDQELYIRMDNLFKENGWFVYSLKNTEEIIGFVFLGTTWMNTQISYYIDQEFRQNGYTIEATKALLDDFIKHNKNKNLEYIVGYIKEENKASQKILTTLGFKYSSTFEYQLYYYYL